MKVQVLAALCATVAFAGCAHSPGGGAAPRGAGPRLYILDCGDIKPMDPNLFGLRKEEIAGDGSFVTPCYLVVHPRGTLIWDVGQIPDAQIPDDGTEVVVQDLIKAKRKLLPQLEALGYAATDITYLAMSHYHLDHTANANLFAASTWIVQQAEYDAMFGATEFAIRDASSYDRLKDARRITLHDADHDVFGDGSVIVKTAPGHTPGHQMLFLRLEKFGPLLLEGDLYHLPEERTLDRVPTFDFDAAMTRATRAKTEAFLEETGAQMWIQHDPPTHAALRKAPDFYE
jgi:glyoxylase-like metal-dependent hydrolase (beta-lactamase superfamily II)